MRSATYVVRRLLEEEEEVYFGAPTSTAELVGIAAVYAIELGQFSAIAKKHGVPDKYCSDPHRLAAWLNNPDLEVLHWEDGDFGTEGTQEHFDLETRLVSALVGAAEKVMDGIHFQVNSATGLCHADPNGGAFEDLAIFLGVGEEDLGIADTFGGIAREEVRKETAAWGKHKKKFFKRTADRALDGKRSHRLYPPGFFDLP